MFVLVWMFWFFRCNHLFVWSVSQNLWWSHCFEWWQVKDGFLKANHTMKRAQIPVFILCSACRSLWGHFVCECVSVYFPLRLWVERYIPVCLVYFISNLWYFLHWSILKILVFNNLVYCVWCIKKNLLVCLSFCSEHYVSYEHIRYKKNVLPFLQIMSFINNIFKAVIEMQILHSLTSVQSWHWVIWAVWICFIFLVTVTLKYRWTGFVAPHIALILDCHTSVINNSESKHSQILCHSTSLNAAYCSCLHRQFPVWV